jgi:PHD/YefM family antitoxin component YafN of YafNO toxin-antitoxin module
MTTEAVIVMKEVNVLQAGQNLNEILIQMQSQSDGILINQDGQPVAALVDAELFSRIRRMRQRFDALTSRIADAYSQVPVDQGLAEIDALVAAERAS